MAMKANNKQVTPRQATAIIVNTIISGRLLILPRELAATAGTSSWSVLILGTLISLAILFIYTTVGRRFQDSSLPQYAVKTLGPFIGGMLSLTFVAIWLIVAALGSRIFSAVIVTSVLPRISLETSILIMLLLGAHLATKGVKTVARVHELFFPFIVVAVVLLIAPSLTRISVWRMLPIIQLDNIRSLGLSTLWALTSFLGFEIISLFMPFYSQPEKSGRSHSMGLIIVAAMFLLVVEASIGVFGVVRLTHIQWPTLTLVRVIGFHGIFERLEAPFLAIYVIVMFTTIGSMLFGVTSTLSDLFKIKSRVTWPYFLVIPAYYLALRPQNIVEVEQVLQWTLVAHLAVVLTVPLIVLPIAAIRGKEDRPDEKQTAKS